MTPDDIAFCGILLSAVWLGILTWRRRRKAQRELARRKARAEARYMARYRQQGIL
jgi:hypothetical protein